jgi:phosphoribosylanthranilate isomerase
VTAIKICCIRDRAEARLALDAGADVLGFVGEQPSGPGRLADDEIAELIAWVGGRGTCWLLSSTTDAEALVAQVAHTRPAGLQICDAVEPAVYEALRRRFPDLTLMQVVHVAGPEAVGEARQVRPHVDGILLDSGIVAGPERQLGGTGRTHDWAVSARIVAEVQGPVWLAGGLNPGNVGAAIGRVHPAGVDLCSGVRDADYRLDAYKLAGFVAGVRAADGALDLPAGATMADFQRYVHDLEALHGWLDTDLVHNGFLMVEEVGELHAAIRRVRKAVEPADQARLRAQVGEEIVDVLNYLLAIANRLEIDVEAAFREKNARNQLREWE